MSLQLGTPIPLAANHIPDDFACGEPSLDEWLKRRALANQLSGAARQTPANGQNGIYIQKERYTTGRQDDGQHLQSYHLVHLT
jgi:hypothetical protein